MIRDRLIDSATSCERDKMQPTLLTNRLELVPLSDHHFELELELDSDPEVLRYLYDRARTRAEVRESHEEKISVAKDAPGFGFWIGYSEGIFVGWWVLRPPHGPHQREVPGEADLGYRLLRRHWRRGFASEGARELLRYGFEDLDLSRIFAQTMAVNDGSRAVMASIGMAHVRTFIAEFDDPLPGTDQGEVEYAISREQWLGTRSRPEC